jgi:DNA-binding CsgD family transcriptional regulator
MDDSLAYIFRDDYEGLSKRERQVLDVLSAREAASEPELSRILQTAPDLLRNYLLNLEQLGYVRYADNCYRLAHHFARAWLKEIGNAAAGEQTPSPISEQASLEIATQAACLPETEVAWDTATIRQFLTQALSDHELRAICFDHFRPVYDTLATGMSKGQIIQLLMEECDRRCEWTKLIEIVSKVNAQYSHFKLKLRQATCAT